MLCMRGDLRSRGLILSPTSLLKLSMPPKLEPLMVLRRLETLSASSFSYSLRSISELVSIFVSSSSSLILASRKPNFLPLKNSSCLACLRYSDSASLRARSSCGYSLKSGRTSSRCSTYFCSPGNFPFSSMVSGPPRWTLTCSIIFLNFSRCSLKPFADDN